MPDSFNTNADRTYKYNDITLECIGMQLTVGRAYYDTFSEDRPGFTHRLCACIYMEYNNLRGAAMYEVAEDCLIHNWHGAHAEPQLPVIATVMK